MVMRSYLLFQGSPAEKRDLFYDGSTGDSCPLRIPLDKLGAAASPIDTP